MPTIRIDDEVWRELQKRAQAFVDTPNDVLRGLLGLNHTTRGASAVTSIGRKARGQVTSDKDYYVPILEVVSKLGGRAQVSRILGELESRVRSQLKPSDFEILKSGEVRWRKAANFARNDMVHRMRPSLLSSSSPRGWWEITQAGRDYLERRRNGNRPGS